MDTTSQGSQGVGGEIEAQPGADAMLAVSAGAASGDSPAGDSPDLSAAFSALMSAAQSLLVQRHQFARRLGLSGFDQFHGARQINEVLGYPTSLSLDDYRDRFENGGIARRIVEMKPDAMGWSKVAISESREGLKRKTKLEKAWDSLCKRLNIGNVFKRADVQAGIGEYAVIYIGVKEKKGANASATGSADILAQPLSRLTGPDDIVFLRPLSQDQAFVTEFVGDSADDRVDDPRYGMPKYYNIQLSKTRRHLTGAYSAALNSSIRKVHWTRVIHVTHEPLDNEIFSAPELQPVWRYLCDLDKLAGGGSEIFWKQALQKVLFDLDKDIGPDGSSISGATMGTVDTTKAAAFKDSLTKLKSDLEEMMHNLRPHAFSRGVTPKFFAGDPVDFDANVKTILALIAATKKVPQRKLTGSETTYDSATQDDESYDDTIGARQEDFGTSLVRQFVDRLIEYNGLPAPADDYIVEWPVEDEMSEMDKAKKVNLLALANLNQTKAGGTVIVTSDEIRDTTYSLKALPKQTVDETPTKPKDLNLDGNPASDQVTQDSQAGQFAINAEHKFSSTQINIPSPLREQIISLGTLLIADSDLTEDGRETIPHVTIKYGIETNKAALVAELVKGYGVISVTFGKTQAFSSAEFDVVYVSAESSDLVKLNALISSTLKVTDTHSGYIPHATLACVKTGMGADYVGDSTLEDQCFFVSSLTFSDQDGNLTEISTL